LPIDVQKSDWFCTLERLSEQDRKLRTGAFAVRTGLRYVRGLRKTTGDAIADARIPDGPFASEYDLCRRVASIKKSEMVLLAESGAFNWAGEKHHRRAALWHAERAGQSRVPDRSLKTCQI
jgi:error-prone DNA polymerase